MNLHSGRASVAMLRMMGCANGRSARHLLHSDCVVEEKTVVLQKKENEGFGFVLRGAKGRNVRFVGVCSSLCTLFRQSSFKGRVYTLSCRFVRASACVCVFFCSNKRISKTEVMMLDLLQ